MLNNFKVLEYNHDDIVLAKRIRNQDNLFYQREDELIPFSSNMILDFPVIGKKEFIPHNYLLEINVSVFYKMFYVIPTLVFKIKEGYSGETLYEENFSIYSFPNTLNNFTKSAFIKSRNPGNLIFLIEKYDNILENFHLGKNSSITIRGWPDRPEDNDFIPSALI